MADVFISYVRRDHPRIVELSDALEAEGFTTWWDRQIGGGARFASQIEEELNTARAVVVAWSNDSLQSEWVMDEAEVAKQAGKLIPISLDGSQPPIGFRQYQVLNFQNWKGARQASSFQELKKSIERFHYGAITSEETQSTRKEVRAPKNTIAVLPLENMTGDPAQQYFVDGMHATLITSLSRVSALSVLSRTSTKIYANTTKSMREIGAELGAAKIIEGTVYRNGDQVSISVNLIDASTDIHDWSENYDREISDILQLQRDAAKDIADQVSVMLTPSEQNRFAAAPRVSPTAYDAYLKGMYHWYQLTPESLHQGIEQFNRSLTADVDFAPAYAGIGACWAGLQQMGAEDPRIAQPKIEEAVEKAIALDDGLAEAHFSYGVYCTWSTYDWELAEKSFLRAIELDSSFPDTFAYYAHYLCIVGRHDEASAPIERAINRDPFNPLIRALYAAVLLSQGRYEQAETELLKVVHMAPNHWLGYEVLRVVYHRLQNADKAVAATAKMFSLMGKQRVADALNEGYSDKDYCQSMTKGAEALAGYLEEGGTQLALIAQLHAFGEEFELAGEYIEKAFENSDPALPYIRHTGIYPREMLLTAPVQRVLEKMNFPGEPIQ